MRALWDSLEFGQEVPVIYVPSKPEPTRLAFGEVISRTSPVASYAMGGFIGLLGLFLTVGGIPMRSGREVHFDSNTMRLSIKRFGAR